MEDGKVGVDLHRGKINPLLIMFRVPHTRDTEGLSLLSLEFQPSITPSPHTGKPRASGNKNKRNKFPFDGLRPCLHIPGHQAGRCHGIAAVPSRALCSSGKNK